MNSKAREIFTQAAVMAPEERDSYLTEACGDDAELRLEVQRLLVDAQKADALFGSDDEGATIGAEDLDSTYTEAEGDEIGPYTLRQEIGEGGFGVVWMAEQTGAISRMVALKVLKAGMDTRQVLARFEAERQAVAMMDHPNIAKILDAGATPAGRPYFVMELVRGIPITEFCDQQKFGPRRRLELFRDVCSAINHAHQKGIIHRDLKPSNIMVTLAADVPVVKVIDFGIAKATHSKLTEKTLFTRFEQFLGTPVYMSPEQAAMSAIDVDTRSDIYSLGVLLYELLAGAPPFDQKSLLSAGYDEMRRIIAEDEPPKPSTRCTQTQADSAAAAGTATEARPKKFYVSASSLKGELDWIVMKAIEKDRTRRYDTANALAADIGRYLADRPVQAAAPGAAYKFRKFARRNKAALGVGVAMVVLLLAGIAATSWQAIRATAQKEKAEEATIEAQYNEGLGWMLRAEVAEKEGHRYPDTLLYAARAIGFDGVGRPEGDLDDLPLLIRKDRDADDYEMARRWIRERPHYLPVWSSSLPGVSSAITNLGVSPTGRRLAVRSEDGGVRLWDFAAADPKATEISSASGGAAQAIAFHPDGKRLAVADAERVRFWDLEKSAYTVEEHVGSASVLAISPDGRFLAGAAADGSIVVWGDGEEKVVIQSGQTSSASGLTFGPDGEVLAAVFPGLLVRVFFHEEDQVGRRSLRSWEKWAQTHPGEAAKIGCVAFSPDGLSLAIGSENGGVSLWDVATAQQLGEVDRQQRHTGAVRDLNFSSDGRQLASASADGTVKLWELESNKLRVAATLNGHGTEVTVLTYLRGGMLLAGADAAGRVRLWNVSGRTGDKPGLHRYREESWYVVGTEQVVPAAGKGFLGLPPDSVVGLWQRGEGASDRLFSQFLEHRNYGAAAVLVADGADGGKRGEQLAEALLTDAQAAVADRHWHRVRLRLGQKAALGADESGAARVAEIESRLPGNPGTDFQIEEGFEMVWCPQGSLTPDPFMVGDPGSQTEVTLESGFWIGKYEITNSQYGALMGRAANARIEGNDQPAVAINWHEAREFCRRLTISERLRGAIPPGWEYALPTSAQWEYACRAGTTTVYSFGDDEEALDDYAWYSSNSFAHAVGTKKANPWELHDMHGNVWEWTGTFYNRGASRITRGGSYHYDDAASCRSAARRAFRPTSRYFDLGFRPALVPAGQSEGEEEAAGDGVTYSTQPSERSGGGGTRRVQAVVAVLVAPDSEWRWLHPLDGVDPADADPDFHLTFHTAGYEDTSWKTGKDSEGATGGFGYGDDWFTGVDIGLPGVADQNGKRTGKSAYFRYRFTTTKEHTNLELRCQRDDGIIVYLDGKEVARDNMREGEEAYALPAVVPVGQFPTDRLKEQTTYAIPLGDVALAPGEHILAISLHNTAATSSDLRIGGITLVEVEERE